MTVRIEAKRLIPGRGDAIANGVVVMEGGEIAFAGPADSSPATPEAEVVATDTVMPGMWECHGHFLGTRSANIDEVHVTRPQIAALRASVDAQAALDAGFTSVREVGGHGSFLARVIDEGTLLGPTIYASGSMLSTTAGHGDIHDMDFGAASASLARHWGEDNVVDGPDQARAGVRRMLRLGAKVIKVHASGGVLSQLDDPHLPQFTVEELKVIVDEASRMERLVAAHCHGKRGMMNAIEAGVKTIEHGTYMDDEVAEAMKETGTILVPTRWILEFLMAEGESRGMPEYAKQKLLDTAAHHADGIALAVSKGVRIAMGTDIFGAGLWGRNGEELPLLVACGMSPMQAIEAATANGPMTVGLQARNTGQLTEGMDADVLCVAGDPTADVAVLADPANITTVFKRGVRVKG